MSGNLSNNTSSFSTSPYKMTNLEETDQNLSNSYPLYIQNQSNNSPIKRALSSVDMLCPKFVIVNNKMNRTQSYENFNKLQMSDDYKQVDTKKRAFDDIWSSIQEDNNQNLVGSDSSQVPPPYVHPLVRRSTSSLSEKSLEICTESLGSETGSDGFTYPASDPEGSDHEQEVEEIKLSKNDNNVVVEEHVVKFDISKKGPLSMGRSPNTNLGLKSKSFPPPLSSLAQRDGSNIHMRSVREHGRLVLEAVSVPSTNCFRAHRQDGRLLLTLADDVFEDDPFDEEQKVDEESDDEEEMIEYEEDMSKNVEHVSSNRLIIDPFIVSKVRALPRFQNSSIWPRTINVAVVKAVDNRQKDKKSFEKEKKLFRQSNKLNGPIISSDTANTDSIINMYKYYWRQNTTVAVIKSVVGQQIADKAISAVSQVMEREKEISKLVLGHKGESMSLIQQGVVLVKAERVGARSAVGERVAHDEYLVPLLRGCKEHRMKSFLFLDPYCIVTS